MSTYNNYSNRSNAGGKLSSNNKEDDSINQEVSEINRKQNNTSLQAARERNNKNPSRFSSKLERSKDSQDQILTEMVKEARKIFGNDREAMNRFLNVKQDEIKEKQKIPIEPNCQGDYTGKSKRSNRMKQLSHTEVRRTSTDKNIKFPMLRNLDKRGKQNSQKYENTSNKLQTSDVSSNSKSVSSRVHSIKFVRKNTGDTFKEIKEDSQNSEDSPTLQRMAPNKQEKARYVIRIESNKSSRSVESCSPVSVKGKTQELRCTKLKQARKGINLTATKQTEDDIESKALYNYELFHDLPKGTANYNQVKSSNQGIQGWANYMPTEPSQFSNIKQQQSFFLDIKQTDNLGENEISQSCVSQSNEGDNLLELEKTAFEGIVDDISDKEYSTQRLKEIEKENQQIRLKQYKEIIDQYKPEPLVQLSHKYAEGTDSPAWRRKQVRHQQLSPTEKKNRQNRTDKSQNSSDDDDDDEDSDILPGDNDMDKENNRNSKLGDSKNEASEQKKPKRQKNKVIQDKLSRLGEKIKIQSEFPIKKEQYSNFFGYQIFDGYRPQNLAQTRDYLHFLTMKNNSLGEKLNDYQVPAHILEYLQRDYNTKLPKFINESKILVFDQNFECGNIDSVYIHNCETYNMLMKVDSNTKGNMYWFYFKVQNFRIGVRYTFHIFNFTRSIDKFYKEGMNIVTRAVKISSLIKEGQIQSRGSPSSLSLSDFEEHRDIVLNEPAKIKINFQNLKVNTGSNYNTNGTNTPMENKEGEWRYNTCQNVLFDISDIPREGKNQYYKLTFQYTFTQEDMGKSVHFAYAVPYTYTDLLQDLKKGKQNILKKKGVSDDDSPKIKILKKEDYQDYYKFQNFNNYTNSDMLPLHGGGIREVDISSPTKAGDGSHSHKRRVTKRNSNKMKIQDPSPNSGNIMDMGYRSGVSKICVHKLQSNQISKAAKSLMNNAVNTFENKIMSDVTEDQHNIKKYMLYDTAGPNAVQKFGQDSYELNFEITNKHIHYRQEVIGQSIGGLNIYQLTLTKRRDAGSIRHRRKQVIYIQARLHAAETHGSFIMSKIIEELTSNYHKYDSILNTNIIKIIPMINPDGVVLGNSRSSLAGVDLNRRWGNPNPIMHPEIYFLKETMRATSQQSAGITIFCDLHGHNKQQNCFFYGCNKAPNEGLLSWTKTRLLPKIYDTFDQIFDFQMCKFSQEKTKYNTARVVVWNEFQVINSFTLETSMHGRKVQDDTYARKKHNIVQLVRSDLDAIALNLMKAIRQYKFIEPELDKEFKNTGGWLKKKKLDELSGQVKIKKNEALIQNNIKPQQHQFPRRQNTQNFFKQDFTALAKLNRANKANSIKGKSTRNVIVNSPVKQGDQSAKGQQLNQGDMQNFNKEFRVVGSITTQNQMVKQRDQVQKQNSIISNITQAKDFADSVYGPNSAEPNITNGLKLTFNDNSVSPIGPQDTEVSSYSHNMKCIKEEQNNQAEISARKKHELNIEKVSDRIPPSMNNSKKKKKETPSEKNKSPKKKLSNSKINNLASPNEMMEMPDCLKGYFTLKEIEIATKEADIPLEEDNEDIEIQTEDADESDSCPSCDNFELDEFKENFNELIAEDDQINEFFCEEEKIQVEKAAKTIRPPLSELTIVKELPSQLQLLEEEEKHPDQSELNSPDVEEIEIDEDQLRIDMDRIETVQEITEKVSMAHKETLLLSKTLEGLHRDLKKKMLYDKSFQLKVAQQINQQHTQQVHQQASNLGIGRSPNQSRSFYVGNQVVPQVNNNLPGVNNLRGPSSTNVANNFYQDEQGNTVYDDQIFSAGPRSGENYKPGSQVRAQQNNISLSLYENEIQASSMLPSVQANNLQIPEEQKAGGSRHSKAISTGRVNKYKSRTNFNLSTYNMQDGFQQINETKIQSDGRFAMHGNSHVHPQYARTNNMQRQAHRGNLISHLQSCLQSSPNGIERGKMIGNSMNFNNANFVQNTQQNPQNNLSSNIKELNQSSQNINRSMQNANTKLAKRMTMGVINQNQDLQVVVQGDKLQNNLSNQQIQTNASQPPKQQVIESGFVRHNRRLVPSTAANKSPHYNDKFNLQNQNIADQYNHTQGNEMATSFDQNDWKAQLQMQNQNIEQQKKSFNESIDIPQQKTQQNDHTTQRYVYEEQKRLHTDQTPDIFGAKRSSEVYYTTQGKRFSQDINSQMHLTNTQPKQSFSRKFKDRKSFLIEQTHDPIRQSQQLDEQLQNKPIINMQLPQVVLKQSQINRNARQIRTNLQSQSSGNDISQKSDHLYKIKGQYLVNQIAGQTQTFNENMKQSMHNQAIAQNNTSTFNQPQNINSIQKNKTQTGIKPLRVPQHFQKSGNLQESYLKQTQDGVNTQTTSHRSNQPSKTRKNDRVKSHEITQEMVSNINKQKQGMSTGQVAKQKVIKQQQSLMKQVFTSPQNTNNNTINSIHNPEPEPQSIVGTTAFIQHMNPSFDFNTSGFQGQNNMTFHQQPQTKILDSVSENYISPRSMLKNKLKSRNKNLQYDSVGIDSNQHSVEQDDTFGYNSPQVELVQDNGIGSHLQNTQQQFQNTQAYSKPKIGSTQNVTQFHSNKHQSQMFMQIEEPKKKFVDKNHCKFINNTEPSQHEVSPPKSSKKFCFLNKISQSELNQQVIKRKQPQINTPQEKNHQQYQFGDSHRMTDINVLRQQEGPFTNSRILNRVFPRSYNTSKKFTQQTEASVSDDENALVIEDSPEHSVQGDKGKGYPCAVNQNTEARPSRGMAGNISAQDYEMQNKSKRSQLTHSVESPIQGQTTFKIVTSPVSSQRRKKRPQKQLQSNEKLNYQLDSRYQQ